MVNDKSTWPKVLLPELTSAPTFAELHLSNVLTKYYKSLDSVEQKFKGWELLHDSGVHLFKFSTIDTTMRLAKEFPYIDAYTETLGSMPDKHQLPWGSILAFQSDEQTHGRGQHANTWVSPPKGNCYVTFMIRLKSCPFYAA